MTTTVSGNPDESLLLGLLDLLVVLNLFCFASTLPVFFDDLERRFASFSKINTST